MGLDSYVLCNCYKNGKVNTPPVDKDLIAFEENFYYLNLPYKGNEELHRIFDQWKEHACEHKDFKYAHEWISNWGGCSLFISTLIKIGAEYFPTILSEWPSANGGEMSSVKAKMVINELDIFQAKIKQIDGVFLIDTETKNTIYKSIEGKKEEFAWLGNEKMIYAFDETGFYITDFERKKKYFTSKDFTQKVKERKLCIAFNKINHNKPDNVQKKYKVIFEDNNTGIKYKCQNPISDYQQAYPKNISVIKRKLIKEDLSIVDRLRKICEASVEIGNPVVWS